MFPHRYFGNSYFGPHYFGPSGIPFVLTNLFRQSLDGVLLPAGVPLDAVMTSPGVTLDGVLAKAWLDGVMTVRVALDAVLMNKDED